MLEIMAMIAFFYLIISTLDTIGRYALARNWTWCSIHVVAAAAWTGAAIQFFNKYIAGH